MQIQGRGEEMLENYLELIRSNQAQLSKYETHCKKHGDYVEADHRGNCVNCLREADSKRKQQRLQAEKLARIKNAGIGRIYHDANFDNCKPEQNQVASQLKNYKFDKNIVLIGKTGTGKTYLSCALINSVINEKDCYFVKFYKLTDIKIRDNEKFEAMINSNLLIIDEFGVQDTDFKGALAYEIYDYRYENNLPTMLVTNLNAEELKSRMSDALYSRIKSNCLVLVLGGADLRLTAA